jgi:protein-S-isoprenylcysteine O-methyltransferase Ste14
MGWLFQEETMKYLRSIGSFLYTLFLYVGLPVLGWGIDDVSGFFARPQFLGYVATIAGFGVIAAYQMFHLPESLTGGKGQPEKFVPRQRIVRIVVTGLLLLGLVLVPFADRRSLLVMADSPLLRWCGLVLSTLGLGLIFWSGITLGRFYSQEVTLQKDHRLITHGPYRLARHPRYLGILFLGIGQSLLFRSWIGLVMTALAMAIVLFRIRDEEVLMSREFGAEWQTYCSKSWKLIPYLW